MILIVMFDRYSSVRWSYLQLFVVLTFLCCSLNLFSRSAFHVGNSHTWDLKPNYGLRKIFEAGDEVLENDWQIVCGQSLDYIVRNPSSACVFPENYQDYVDALTDKAWEVVTIQPFPGATGLAEVEAISDIIDLAGWRSSSGETRYLIYCTWPIVPEGTELVDFNYDAAWRLPYTSTLNGTLANEEFYIYAMKSIRDQHPDLPIEAIPVGAVLEAFHLEAKGGRISGFSGAGELYRDRYHMNNVGRYIAALATYTVVTGNTASDLGSDSIAGFGVAEGAVVDRAITGDLRKKLTELVDSVIAQKPFEDLPLTLDCERKGVSFKTYTGYRYTLEHSNDLLNWFDVIDSAAGDSSVFEYSSPESSAVGFWRLLRD